MAVRAVCRFVYLLCYRHEIIKVCLALDMIPWGAIIYPVTFAANGILGLMAGVGSVILSGGVFLGMRKFQRSKLRYGRKRFGRY